MVSRTESSPQTSAHHAHDATHALLDRPTPCGCCEHVVRSDNDVALPVLRTVRAAAHSTIHRPFFITGIIALLTAGAGWGVWLLWLVGSGRSFTAAPVSAINAHGHAQIYGWVGLFIMGFAFQSFPRMWQAPLPSRALAMATLGMLLAGLVVKTSAMYATGEGLMAARFALAGGALEVAAVVLFGGQLLYMLGHRNAAIAPSMWFVVLASMWFILSTIGSVWHTWNLMTATSQESLLHYLSTYQAALRDAQLHGVALFMILGVSARILPTLFGLPVVSRRRSITAIILLSCAVAGEVMLLIAMQRTGNHAVAGLLYLMWIMLAAGVAVMAFSWKLWKPVPNTNPSAKFVRAAYAWLGLSMIMLLAFPLYQIVSGVPFSHAYYGAIRHAFTVGFISMMIMGVAAAVTANVARIPKENRSGLWMPFVLVMVGCTLRVVLQVSTDFVPSAFKFIGISGALEWIGLAWWSALMLHMLLRPQSLQTARNRLDGQAQALNAAVAR